MSSRKQALIQCERCRTSFTWKAEVLEGALERVGVVACPACHAFVVIDVEGMTIIPEAEGQDPGGDN